MVIFGFGLMVSFIVSLGLVNARDLRTRQRAKDFEYDNMRQDSVTLQSKDTSTKHHQKLA
jgi:hypothetical protein